MTVGMDFTSKGNKMHDYTMIQTASAVTTSFAVMAIMLSPFILATINIIFSDDEV
jgi:hypothetical protein